jgi:hypothetical protein
VKIAELVQLAVLQRHGLLKESLRKILSRFEGLLQRPTAYWPARSGQLEKETPDRNHYRAGTDPLGARQCTQHNSSAKGFRRTSART